MFRQLMFVRSILELTVSVMHFQDSIFYTITRFSDLPDLIMNEDRTMLYKERNKKIPGQSQNSYIERLVFH